MPNIQRITQPTVRRVVNSYIKTKQSDHLTIFPQGCYVIAYGTNTHYPFLWLKVDQDRWSFEKRYKAQHNMNENRKLPPKFVGHLSQQYMFRDPENSQLYVVNHIPSDITDEELDLVVEDRLAKFDLKGGDIIRVNSRRTFSV